MGTDSATLAARVAMASQLSAHGRLEHAFSYINPIADSESDGWRALVGLLSVIRPSITAEIGPGQPVPEVTFGGLFRPATAGDVTLGRIATPHFRQDRAAARSRWSAAFSAGLAPDVLASAVQGAGVCLANRHLPHNP